MSEYWHSVILEKDFCNGCTNCLHRCPTQAIRVIDGRATIINERCIDCGECLKHCPFHAKGALTDTLKEMKKFKYVIALPSIAMYGQFSQQYDINKVFNCLYKIGFDHVFDVAYSADIISAHLAEIIEENRDQYLKPLISTYCPAITRLIQMRYPSLIDHFITLESPMEVSARLARKKAKELTDYTDDEIGVFFISQCPAKITSVKNPLGLEKSKIDGAISIESIYSRILKIYDELNDDEVVQIAKGSGRGIGWGKVGGQSYSIGLEDYIAVDGIDEVIKILDELELGKLNNIEFMEAYACITGCSGGPLNVENPFIAKQRIRKISESKDTRKRSMYLDQFDRETLEWDRKIEALPTLKLDTDFKKALEKMAKIEEIFRILPGIDCGACGAPTCRALAEDIVMRKASLADCVVRKNGGKRNET
ncbi:MAG: 4Fe-4S dicluster domain-containing protein [Firmicutes bacterium]|jgi:iron only hydrogenase large subunit-like protein|nr:4Fe-4S dicluster domain-containing protein [Bacillota bacterium]